jgi:hypothetical protein
MRTSWTVLKDVPHVPQNVGTAIATTLVLRHDGYLAAASSAFLAQSGFFKPDFFIASRILLASKSPTRTANKTPFAFPFGSFGLPILFFIHFVNKNC